MSAFLVIMRFNCIDVSAEMENYLLVIKFLFLCFGSAANWKLGILISFEYLTNRIVFR